MKKAVVSVFSEIGSLQSALLHRPGFEIENITPDLFERFLFDDTPHLQLAIREHNAFANALRAQGVHVYYIEELLVEVFDSSQKIKNDCLDIFIQENFIPANKSQEENQDRQQLLKQYLLSLSNTQLVARMIAGLEVRDLIQWSLDQNGQKQQLSDLVPKVNEISFTPGDVNYPFVFDPSPNYIFQRDPAAFIYSGISVNKMKMTIRRKEALLSTFVFQHHPLFAQTKLFYDRNQPFTIEGGDIMVLNEQNLIIGLTERTEIKAVEQLSKTLFESYPDLVISVIDLPKRRAFMHLDAVFTHIDYDKFIFYPPLFKDADSFGIYQLRKNQSLKKIEGLSLADYLTKLVGHKITLIPCGGESPIAMRHEQWNDGTNVLTVRPGCVIAYSRNHITNSLLRQAGVEVIEIPDSEISRARGGPRCMSMPIVRKKLL